MAVTVVPMISFFHPERLWLLALVPVLLLLYAALVRHDFPAFAAAQLKEREQAGFPPYAYQAMLRAEAPQMAAAIAYLATARAWPRAAEHPEVMCYDPVPMRLARRASLERAQLLIESPSRRALHRYLGAEKSG